MISSPAHILRHADAKQLEQAAADNYKQMVSLEAIAWGGEVKEKDGLLWTYAGAGRSANILFSSPAAEHSGVLLDEMMDYFRAHPPNNAGYWSLDPPQPAGIGVQLLARGFQPGWKPCWMGLDLEAICEPHSAPADLRLRGDNDTDIRPVKELPYSANDNLLTPAMRRSSPGLVQRFIASHRGKIVGQSAVFFSSGDYGVAGIYNVGVVPRMQNKGIGKAVTLAACLYARERGYRYAVLNATPSGRRIYEQLGFRWVGDGVTWWLTGDRWQKQPPTTAQVALAEAIGYGDTTALDRMKGLFTASELNGVLANKLTWMELAVHCRQPASAEWLLAQGAGYTALDAWGLGWKDRAAALLAANREEVNRQYGEGKLTLLHIAAQQGDAALARLALQAGPDVSIRDAWHDSTPLGWAQFFQRPEIIEMIKSRPEQYSTN